MHATLVACLYEQFDVRVHERYSHRYGRTIRQDKIGILAKFLDDAKDIVPSTTIKTGAMVAKLVYDLVR